MRGSRAFVGFGAVLAVVGVFPGFSARGAVAPSGRVETAQGTAAAGAMVTAEMDDGRRISVYAAEDGTFRLPDAAVGAAGLRVRLPGVGEARATAGEGLRIRLGPDLEAPSGAAWLSKLPDGVESRRFILDCTGCHVTDATRVEVDGRPRNTGQWQAALGQMRALFGPGTGFPIISSWAEPAVLAPWLAEVFAGERPEAPRIPGPSTGAARGAVLTEFPIPVPEDLPHDLMVDAGGLVWITGMFTHRMYRLDSTSGAFTTTDIPVPGANPRALDIDSRGRVWVVLGGPGRVAIHDPADGTWTDVDVGMYAHSIAVDGEGRGWVNGHFSFEPELVAAVDAASGEVETFEVPPDPDRRDAESTIPYGLRVAPDGGVWGTQLRGNRLVHLDPSTGRVRQWSMPESHAGPRRPDLDARGRVWIPLYSANALARFDPETEEFRVWEFPVEGALPYVIRVDRVRGTVWVGTGHGDVVAAFDPEAESFVLHPLPTRGALVRHLDVDEARGDVWFAYGASPGIPGAVLRLEPGGR